MSPRECLTGELNQFISNPVSHVTKTTFFAKVTIVRKLLCRVTVVDTVPYSKSITAFTKRVTSAS